HQHAHGLQARVRDGVVEAVDRRRQEVRGGARALEPAPYFTSASTPLVTWNVRVTLTDGAVENGSPCLRSSMSTWILAPSPRRPSTVMRPPSMTALVPVPSPLPVPTSTTTYEKPPEPPPLNVRTTAASCLPSPVRSALARLSVSVVRDRVADPGA